MVLTAPTRSNRPVALITGASRGIGAATARLFAKQGYDICINYHSDKQSAHQVQEDVLDCGVNAICVKADVSVERDVLALFDEVDKHFGTLGVLVNNAGIIRPQMRLQNMTSQRVLDLLHTNILGPILCCREAVKRMSTAQDGKGGTIVNVSSGAARTGSPNEYIDYAATKGAIDTLTKGLSVEVAGEGIRVNGVRPGFIDTQMHADGGEPGRISRLQSLIPLQRGGRVEEVAEAIYWLASEKASYTTGSIIDVTGGC